MPSSRAGVLLLTAAVLMSPVSCRRNAGSKIRVVATTTLAGAIVEEVGGSRVQVTTIAPAGFCPGHFDAQPSAVVAVNEARLLISHGWEQWLPKLEQAVANPDLVKVTAQTQGNWMVPPVHQAALREVAAVLAGLDTASARYYLARADSAIRAVDSVSRDVRGVFAGRSLPATIAADKQEPFLAWLGFPVVATYDRPEDFTAAELSRLARVAVDSGVRLVVDNLQSGPDAGLALAQACGAAHVNLTNFPLHGSYIESLRDNARALLDALVTAPSAPQSQVPSPKPLIPSPQHPLSR